LFVFYLIIILFFTKIAILSNHPFIVHYKNKFFFQLFL
jgi:hypothetical protein